ncbi:MAG: pyridoxal-phosphate dependent enzyme [Patescibacteria group bacterium]
MPLSTSEEKILKSIKVASENDPTKPEFPPENPKFPATPTFKIEVPGFSNVWLKDESSNPTGTHKDRMAWEIIVTYRDFLIAKKQGQIKGDLPRMSIISSGSAAASIQYQLKKHSLPNLKVLADTNTNPRIIEGLKKLECEIYQTDLSKQSLDWKQILQLTNNPNGFDLNSSEALDPTTRFYDWLSYEIINESPDYCFIPFGTGNLYENILNVNKREVSLQQPDPRFSGKIEVLRKCNFIGSTTNNSKSKADKLYSPHLPFVHYIEQWMKLYKYAGYCGPESDVFVIQETFLDHAMEIAQKQKITCEPSGIAGLALMLQMKDSLPKNRKMLIVNTGKAKLIS